MGNKIDNLFRNKLVMHQANPSPMAWEKLNAQLVSKKKSAWKAMIGIAASVIFLVGLAYLGYRSLDGVDTANQQVAIEIDDLPFELNEPSEKIEFEKSPEIPELKKENEVAAVKAQKPKEVIQTPAKTKVELAHKSEDFKVEDTENEIKNANLIAEVVTFETDQTILQDEEPVVREITKSPEKTIDKAPGKKYPEVTITYKPGNSPVQARSEKKNILDKGINKITEFSDEHVLTEQRKEMLRNTKDDLLALNFGKLIKTNKDYGN